MLKTISAVLLAVSVLAAPALAATSGKTAQAPVIKAEQTKQLKPTVRTANANMGRHHRHYSHYNHHRSHKHVDALNTKGHKFSKVTIKHTGPASKHG